MSTPTTAEFVAGTSIALLAIVAIAIGTIVPAAGGANGRGRFSRLPQARKIEGQAPSVIASWITAITAAFY